MRSVGVGSSIGLVAGLVVSNATYGIDLAHPIDTFVHWGAMTSAFGFAGILVGGLLGVFLKIFR